MPSPLQQYLTYYLSLVEPEYAVLVTGDWGVGKTFQVRNCLSKSKSYYVSLYGLTTTESIHEAVLAEMAPAVSQARKHLPNVVSGLLSVAQLSSLNSLTPGLCSALLRRNVKIDKVLIFDDLERCRVELSDLFGTINTYIEHHKCNVVIVAHDEKVVESFSHMKEKLVGHTIRVTPDIPAAFERFASSHTSHEYRVFLLTHQETLVSTFSASRMASLRLLRYAMEDLRRLYNALGVEHRKNPQAMAELVALFVAFNLEVRAGHLTQKDIEGRESARIRYLARSSIREDERQEKPPLVSANEKYQSVDLESTLLNDHVLLHMLVEGVYSEIEIQNSMNNSAYFLKVEESDTPPWKIIMNFREVDDDVVDSAVYRMREQFKTREVEEPGELLHIFALLMMMSAMGISREPLNYVTSECKKYIDDLFQESRLRPTEWKPDRERRPEGYFDGFAYWIMDAYRKEFNDVSLHLNAARKRALERELPGMASELLDELRNDSEQFNHSIWQTDEGMGRFSDIAVLHLISPEAFIAAWLANPESKLHGVSYALENRYAARNRLQEEHEWARNVVDVLRKMAENTQGFRSLRIRSLCPKLSFLESQTEDNGK